MTVHCLDALALCQPKGGAKVRAQNLPMCFDEDTGFASHCSARVLSTSRWRVLGAAVQSGVTVARFELSVPVTASGLGLGFFYTAPLGSFHVASSEKEANKFGAGSERCRN